MALCTLADVKNAIGIQDSVDDARLTVAMQASEAMIEDYCGRTFTQAGSTSARIYVALNWNLCHVDDISTTTGLIIATDPGTTGTFDTIWTATDYQLEPLNGLINGRTRPWNTIRAIGNYTFPLNGAQALVKVTAKWGWAAIPEAVKQAAIIQTISTFKSVDAPFGATPFAETGVLRLRQSLHPTAAALLSDYRLDPVQVD